MSLTDQIKDYALDLGYSAVGVTTADPYPQLTSSLEERKEDYVNFPDLHEYADARNSLPEAKSIIVAAFDYFTEDFPTEFVGKICRFHMSRCYKAAPNRIGGVRPELMRKFLLDKGYTMESWNGRRSLTALKQSVVRSGIGLFGKNTLTCVPSIGTFVMINAWVVDGELEYDTPNSNLETHCPPNCNLCREACPTGALKADFRLDPRRCITLNTLRNRGGNTGISPYIPKEIRSKIGTWIHGCDICQQVCPKNEAKLKKGLKVNPYLAKKATEFDLVSLLHMTDEYFWQVVRPIMYTHIQEDHKELFRRNAAVALGNIGDPDSVPALASALDDPEEVVRVHAAWALGRIGGRSARNALESHLISEIGEHARYEIEDALAEMS
jgi:epoxyqueuosine reductase